MIWFYTDYFVYSTLLNQLECVHNSFFNQINRFHVAIYSRIDTKIIIKRKKKPQSETS